MKKKQLNSKLEQQLRAAREERQAARREPALLTARTALKRYQAERLASTHADLLAAPDTRDAALFFLEELYGSHDLGERDLALERIVPAMQRLLSYEALHTITEAIVLDALSERLDTAMARELGSEFTQQQYLDAYRTVSTRAERERQLDLVRELGASLCALVRAPLVSMTLAAMRTPARLAGLGKLQAFLERGLAGFRQMKQPDAFVATVVERERRLLERIFAGSDDPFGL